MQPLRGVWCGQASATLPGLRDVPLPAEPSPRRRQVKKIINDPFAFVDEMLDGILRAHPGELRLVGPDKRVVVRADAPVKGKVGIATGGGSGHLPVFMGY